MVLAALPQLTTQITEPVWKKSYEVGGWVNEVETCGNYVVSEYSGTLRYALASTADAFDIDMNDAFLTHEDLGTDHFEIQAIRTPEKNGSQLVIGGVKDTVFLVDFSTGNEGTVKQSYVMETSNTAPDVLTIGVQTNYWPGNFWVSCDEMYLYRFTVGNTTPVSKFVHGLDMIKEIAINSESYLASGIQRYLVLRSLSTGSLLHKFTTADLMLDSEIHRINGIASIELDLNVAPEAENVLGLYAVATDNSRLFIYDSKIKRSVGQRDFIDSSLLLDIIQIEGTEFLAINRYDTIDFLKFTDLSGSSVVGAVHLPGSLYAITRFIQTGKYLSLGTDEGTMHVLELSE
jgi:hypothetical protein